MADHPANPPAGQEEGFAGGSHGEGELCDLGAQRCHASEGNITHVLVDFVGDDYDVVLDTEVADGL